MTLIMTESETGKHDGNSTEDRAKLTSSWDTTSKGRPLGVEQVKQSS